MQVLILCLIFLAVENVQLVRNEQLDTQEALDSTQFKNAVAKELLKKKLSTLESARQQGSLAAFLRKGGKNLSGLRTAPKSSFHKDDDPSRKQAQMANTFIASSNLLFGTKSQQRKACTGGKQANKEMLDMRSLRQTYSGYNEDGSDFSISKESPKIGLDNLNESLSSALKKRSNPNKAVQDPISCYLTEPKKVTCMHKDIIYKIALPSSEVADDEIGRIVESIYRAVEGKTNGKTSFNEPIDGAPSQTSLEGSVEAAGNKKTSDDSSKKKRASEDYLRSLFLNNLLVANHKTLPNYNNNNPVFIPLLIPMTHPKLEQPKAQSGYYTGLAVDPRLQIPLNLSSAADPLANYQTGRNTIFENGYNQYMVPDGYALPELNLKPRSQVNLTAEEEKRRNWLALMATNGLVPVENGVNPNVLTQHNLHGEVQSIAEEKDSPGGSKLTVAETGEVLDRLLNTRQQRDTYFLRHQLRQKPIFGENPSLKSLNGEERRDVLTKVVQKLPEPGWNVLEERKGCPCPCPCPSDLCASLKGTRRPTKCGPKYPMRTNLLFPNSESLDSADISDSTSKCAIKCSSVQCSTCPEGCQPITTTCKTATTCKTTTCKTTCKPCSKKFDMCGDKDILSKAVSGSMKSEGKLQVNEPNLSSPPAQVSQQNWLPYSPQLLPQFMGQPDHSGKLEFESQKDHDHPQPYFAGENGVQSQYSVQSYPKPFPQFFGQIKNDNNLPKSSKQNEYTRVAGETEEYSGPFHQQDQSQLPAPKNFVRNQIQVNYRLLPSVPAANADDTAQNAVGAHDASFKADEPQNSSNSQADHANASSKQNDTKNKKHRDSFFARLRNKFHKGIPVNATDQDNLFGHQNQHIQNKALLGTSIFKFSTKNQTLGTGKNSTASTGQSAENVSCFNDKNNLPNDQTLTLANQTQPSTVNNINITITSLQPQPGAQGKGQNSNQTNQLPPSGKNQWLTRNPSTARPASNIQSNRTCKVTKIWLCSQQSSVNVTCTELSTCQTKQSIPSTEPSTCQTTPSSTCTEPSTCGTNQTTTCQTQSTCPTTTTTPSTCKTSLSTCDSPTPLSTCTDTCDSNPSNQTTDSFAGADNNPTSTCADDTPSTPTCGSDVPTGYPHPQTENPWSPNDPQMPPGIPGPPSDSSQESPGAKIKTFFNYGPYPVWNQWQYPMERMNPHSPELSLNWQHQTRTPLPSPYIPQVPQPRPPEGRVPMVPTPTPYLPQVVQQKQTDLNPKKPTDPSPKVSLPTTPQGPYQRQGEQLLPLATKRQQTLHQSPYQPQMHGPMWQPPSRQLELDPRWKHVQPSFPIRGGPSGIEIRPDFPCPITHEEKIRGKGNNTITSEMAMGNNNMRKVILPANIKQHIARVRRYLLKKRSKMIERPIKL